MQSGIPVWPSKMWNVETRLGGGGVEAAKGTAFIAWARQPSAVPIHHESPETQDHTPAAN